MTTEDSKLLQQHLKAAAAILLKNTPKEQLQDFTGIELAVRNHILSEVAPEIGNFFKQQQQNHCGTTAENGRSVKSRANNGDWRHGRSGVLIWKSAACC